MINPYIIAADEKDKAIIFGYVIDVKDRGDSNMLLFKKDTMDPSSDIIAVAAWGAVPGQNCSIDMREMTMDCKGRFCVCVCNIRGIMDPIKSQCPHLIRAYQVHVYLV